jgi:hypothetical protein
MISFDVKIERERTRALQRLAEKGVFRSLGNTAAAIRSTARRLITRSREPAAEGEPVHTRLGQAKRPDAVLFHVDRDKGTAVIGFTHAVMGDAMGAHEHGEEYLGAQYPERPTMEPAMKANLVRFADEFEGSIGE